MQWKTLTRRIFLVLTAWGLAFSGRQLTQPPERAKTAPPRPTETVIGKPDIERAIEKKSHLRSPLLCILHHVHLPQDAVRLSLILHRGGGGGGGAHGC